MPSFDIVKTCEPSNSFRVQKIKADFDVNETHANERFTGIIAPPGIMEHRRYCWRFWDG